ncbi:MAG: TDP-N-acetylfucosamine:lipid II N-acetylfucosaminyltransferase [Candidatus Gastranaerophilales bacterium]|nr:TDP-N-acetylfucosamine:lipid II N-acetylfucosaminyltransferase [Candidatus Gastranaerophilales bacterium]
MGLIKNIKREIDKHRFVNKINKNISKYKYVHVMFNDKFNKPFVDLLNKYLNSNEHMIICKRVFFNDTVQPFPIGDNVYEFIKFKGLKLDHNNIKKIVFHSLFFEDVIDYLYSKKDVLNKSYWRIWGGDLYNAPRDKKNDYVRRNFKGYIGIIDREYALNKYGMADNFYKMFYRFPLSKEMLDNTICDNKDAIVIQINHSCNKTTLEMLDILSKYKNENIKIKTVLSYGKYMEYKEPIIQKGKEIFGNKFEYLEKYISPQEYAQYLAQNDILILNQRQQQGFGNTLASLYLGQKVFIRKDISVNQYLNEDGIKIYNSEDIENLSFQEFLSFPERESTTANVTKYLQDEYLAELMEKFFYED